MTTWTPEAVRHAAVDWVWIPDGTKRAGSDVRMLDYPDWVAAGAQAGKIESDRPAAEIIEQAGEQARAWGRDRLNWWISEDTRPDDLERALIDRGAEHDETVAILALDLTRSLPDAPVERGITVEQVTERRQYLDVDVVTTEVWHQEPITEERLDSQLGEEASRGEFRVLARLDGAPVSTGGCTVVDGVARLWGGATLESARHRGAYRGVLGLRLALAQQYGATLAMVKGRADTSAPILRKSGFREYGEERIYVQHLSPSL